MADTPSPPAFAGWQVHCLCAQWCGTCRDWRGAFEQAAGALPGLDARWVDIEDESELVGDLDIETFPTLLISHAGRALFLGPVLPSAAQMQRLLAQLHGDPGAGRAPAEAQPLLQRLLAG